MYQGYNYTDLETINLIFGISEYSKSAYSTSINTAIHEFLLLTSQESLFQIQIFEDNFKKSFITNKSFNEFDEINIIRLKLFLLEILFQKQQQQQEAIKNQILILQKQLVVAFISTQIDWNHKFLWMVAYIVIAILAWCLPYYCAPLAVAFVICGIANFVRLVLLSDTLDKPTNTDESTDINTKNNYPASQSDLFIFINIFINKFKFRIIGIILLALILFAILMFWLSPLTLITTSVIVSAAFAIGAVICVSLEYCTNEQNLLSSANAALSQLKQDQSVNISVSVNILGKKKDVQTRSFYVDKNHPNGPETLKEINNSLPGSGLNIK